MDGYCLIKLHWLRDMEAIERNYASQSPTKNRKRRRSGKKSQSRPCQVIRGLGAGYVPRTSLLASNSDCTALWLSGRKPPSLQQPQPPSDSHRSIHTNPSFTDPRLPANGCPIQGCSLLVFKFQPTGPALQALSECSSSFARCTTKQSAQQQRTLPELRVAQRCRAAHVQDPAAKPTDGAPNARHLML